MTGGTLVRMNRGDLLDHIRDLICVRDNDFFRLLTSQIGKFLQHLLCSAEIKRGLIIRIR